MCVYDIEQSGTQRRTHRILEQRTFASKPNGGSTAERRASHPSSQPSQPLSDGPMSTYIYSSDNGSMAQGVRTRSTPIHSWMRELQKIDGKVGTDCTTACRGPKFYRQWVYPFNPILVDMGRFELDLFTYLNAYAAVVFESHSKSEKWTIDRSIAHISLLLATLSAGAYYSDLDLPQQSYICHDLARRSFQALRLANFLFRPSLDAVQALLVLGNMFQNNSQSDVAWALLGTTVRLAQTIGLHTESIAYLPQYMQLKAKALWLGIEVTTADRDTQETTFYLNILNHLEYVDQRSLPHLTSLQNCKFMHDNLERLELKMHFYLVVAVLTRPALKQSQIQDQLYGILRERAKASIIDASRAFLDFQALSVVPLRTWSMGAYCPHLDFASVYLGRNTK
ncbi:hypothetical protein F9C07_2107724 [Aspergillus flavus]|uniref:Xylanolytic transcriptional activator regulatory domain-containing protein n=1 Tax=Aspergillus flavus (strain ATCC 200026 / FGSC A1120 / IAM 13836 / NRRL 3357 / JCM 12722 / SRRC 167) TaxID=332952 RepID=A0A7U2MIF4_ASPFN|nr:hypothetical protein F9C07_2107724 [Aspergillus flavus]